MKLKHWILSALLLGLLITLALWGIRQLQNTDQAQRQATESKGWEIPADPQEKAEYDLAHSLKLPDSAPVEAWDWQHKPIHPQRIPQPQAFDFCKTKVLGICWQTASAIEYYHHLCQTEAGDYIWRKEKDVKGLLQMRPRHEADWDLFRDLNRMEDPYGYTGWEAESIVSFYQNIPFTVFDFLETRLKPEKAIAFPRGGGFPLAVNNLTADSRYFHYTNYSGHRDHPSVPLVTAQITPTAAYGVTWRGIKRPFDRFYGVAGGEFLIVDLKDNSVLAVRRGFAQTHPQNVNWEFHGMCQRPRSNGEITQVKGGEFFYQFVRDVLHPELNQGAGK